MLTVKACTEKVAALLDRVQALAALATAEKRDMTPEEVAETDKIMGKGKPADADYLAGDLAKAKADLDRAIKVDAAIKEAATHRQRETESDVANGAPDITKVVVPARAMYRRELKAFSGDDAAKQAYAVGKFLIAYVFDKSAKADSPVVASARRWCEAYGYTPERIQAAQSESDNSLGAVLVPELYESAIIKLRERYGVFRKNAKVMPMGSDTVNIPRRTAGLTAYFNADNGKTLTESEKQWDQVKLVAKKAYTLTRWSNELNDDAIISIAEDLADEIAYSFAKLEDDCGFVGDGTSAYGSIVGCTNALAAGSIVNAATGHTGFATLAMSDFEAAIGTLPNYVDEPKWYISQAGFWASMASLMDAKGGNKIIDIAQGQNGQINVGLRFLGFPVVISQSLNKTLGADVSQIKALVGDLSLAATLGTRKGVGVTVSDQRYFAEDQIGIRGVERFDINVHEIGTATAAGALVALKSAAS